MVVQALTVPGGQGVGGGLGPGLGGGWRGNVVGAAVSTPGGNGAGGVELQGDVVAVDEAVVAGAEEDEVVGLA